MNTPAALATSWPAIGAARRDEVGIRADIQALRGWAVLLVLLYHARVPPVTAGYLGVDVFFVISGYLVGGMILRGVEAGTFSVVQFYWRRAMRLLPAAYATLAGTTALCALVLTPHEMREFAWQQLGAITFTGNVVLWLQSGYFDTAANLKPLLHVWSLSLEEQFYLLLPAVLVFLPSRSRRTWIIAATLASLVLCVAMTHSRPTAAFYLLPTRAWELALGTLIALDVFRRVPRRVLEWVFWPAIAVLVLVPLHPSGWAHPGADALLVCTATAVVIVREHRIGPRHPIWPLVAIGNLSYSLYLVHWPLFALVAAAWLVPSPWTIRCAVLIFSFLLAWLLHNFVEQPFRRAHRQPNLRMAAWLLVSSSLLALVPFALSASPAAVQSAADPNIGLDPSCDAGARFIPTSACMTSAQPRILLWGDSYAMHLADGIASSSDASLVQATRSTCGPFLGVAPFDAESAYNRTWAMDCLSFNDSVLAYLASHPQIGTVVLSSLTSQYLGGGRLLERDAAGKFTESERNARAAASALARTVAAVHGLGRKVVFVAPPPTGGFDMGRCIERKNAGLPSFGVPRTDCTIPRALWAKERQATIEFLDRYSQRTGLPLVKLDEAICSADACAVEMDGEPLYRDGGHLTHAGSRLVGHRMKLGARLAAAAN